MSWTVNQLGVTKRGVYFAYPKLADPNGNTVNVKVESAHGADVSRAANLIESAPDLLEVLKDEAKALNIWLGATLPTDVREGIGISLDKIQRAIAKAEGK